MIKFPCHCNHTFVVDDDKAGGTIQCPQCGRLNDIPSLSDLEHIERDGTFKIEAPIIESEEDRLEKLRRAFARGTTDDEGKEIDLRPSIHDVRKAGSIEIPLALRDQVMPGAPKYDPETGELIRPHAIGTTEHGNPATI